MDEQADYEPTIMMGMDKTFFWYHEVDLFLSL